MAKREELLRIGRKIRKLRTEKGLTQDALAKKAGLRSGSAISNYEEGVRDPRTDGYLTRIAEVLGTTAKEIERGMTQEDEWHSLHKEYRKLLEEHARVSTSLMKNPLDTTKLVERITRLVREIEDKREEIAKIEARLFPVKYVPIYAKLSAGTPTDVPAVSRDDETGGRLPVLESAGVDYAVIAHGDSLIEAGIDDGDYVLMKSANEAKNGDLVAAFVNGGEGTLKFFYRVDDSVYLCPANRKYKALRVTEDMELQIVGVAVGVEKRAPRYTRDMLEEIVNAPQEKEESR